MVIRRSFGRSLFFTPFFGPKQKAVEENNIYYYYYKALVGFFFYANANRLKNKRVKNQCSIDYYIRH